MSDFVNTVDSIGDEALINSILDRSITEIHDNYATSIGNYAFRSCSALTTVVFPAATSIGDCVFYSCSALTTAAFPAVTRIGSSAFDSCSALTTVDFLAMTSIGNYAFKTCRELTTLDFPSVTSIGSSVFSGCSKLTAVILRSETMVSAGSKNFTSTPISLSTGYIYVPAALVDSYKAATNWSTYADHFRAIEDYPEICG